MTAATCPICGTEADLMSTVIGDTRRCDFWQCPKCGHRWCRYPNHCPYQFTGTAVFICPVLQDHDQ